MAKYRGGVIGLGWPGLLYGLGERQGDWHADDIDRPTPDVDTHRKAHLYDHPGKEGNSAGGAGCSDGAEDTSGNAPSRPLDGASLSGPQPVQATARARTKATRLIGAAWRSTCSSEVPRIVNLSP